MSALPVSSEKAALVELGAIVGDFVSGLDAEVDRLRPLARAASSGPVRDALFLMETRLIGLLGEANRARFLLQGLPRVGPPAVLEPVPVVPVPVRDGKMRAANDRSLEDEQEVAA